MLRREQRLVGPSHHDSCLSFLMPDTPESMKLLSAANSPSQTSPHRRPPNRWAGGGGFGGGCLGGGRAGGGGGGGRGRVGGAGGSTLRREAEG